MSIRDWLWGPHSKAGLLTALATAAIDQAHKLWMIHVYEIAEKGRVTVTPFLDLVFVLNTGVSYSLLDSTSFGWQVALAVFAVLASLAMWVWLARAGTSRLMAVSLGLIIGGAIGNAIDRLLYGGVADFFSLHAYGFYWYVFNIADVAIVAGVVGLLYDSWAASRNGATKPT
ncbi:MAG: signal peptidase II [Hyphomicrobiaceae bacterium]|nr:signal peptidase II [Hyphomicrobiaceae bacterium]